MKWLEVLALRTGHNQSDFAEKEILNLLGEMIIEGTLYDFELYKSITIDTDFRIHLYHESTKAEMKINEIGNQLVSKLKSLGLVNHTLWMQKLDD